MATDDDLFRWHDVRQSAADPGPWAKFHLDGIQHNPAHYAFQRTHPVVRDQILTHYLQNGKLDQYNELLPIHRAQSAHDRVRASQGWPSPYAHPSQQQPWGNMAQNPRGTTMLLPEVRAAVKAESDWWKFSAGEDGQ